MPQSRYQDGGCYQRLHFRDTRREFFETMDAANVDLKGFTEEFYSKITYSHLQPVLETLKYLVRRDACLGRADQSDHSAFE